MTKQRYDQPHCPSRLKIRYTPIIIFNHFIHSDKGWFSGGPERDREKRGFLDLHAEIQTISTKADPMTHQSWASSNQGNVL